MSIQNKFLLPVMFVIVVAGIMVYLSLTNVVEKNFEENQHDWFETKVSEIDKIQSSMSKNALIHSAIYSKDPRVIENYTLAHSGNIENPTDFSSSLARENLREYFSPIQDGINSNTNENYKIHFHLPNGRSLLRTWQKTQKKNGEDISDDISSFRNTVVQINSGNHKPIDGIEIGRSGFSIRGISPITGNGQHLGSVEMIYDFNPVINSVDFTEHDDYAVLMNAEFSDIATSLNDRKKHPVVRNDYIFVTSTNDNKILELLNSNIDENIETSEYLDFGKNLVLGSPIKDFSGKEIGLLLIVNDVSAQKAELASLKRNIVFGILASLFFAGMILIYNVRSVVKPLKEITSSLSRVALGDLSLSVDIYRKDEIGDLADSFRGIIKAQKDKLLVADEIANGNLDVKIDKASDMDQFAISMNKMRDNIKRQQFESENILKSIGAPMFVTDENLVVKSINEAALGAVGYKAHEVVGKMTCGDMCRTPICGTENCTIKNAMKSGEVVVGETKAKTRDNSEIPISAVCSALFDENGKAYGGMEILFDQSVQKETLSEVGRLIDAAAKGMLSERAKMGRSEGDYRKLLEGVNEMLDNIVEPLKESMDVLKYAADNDLSTRVNGNYKGDFDELKRNLNTAIDNLDSSLAQVENAASQVSSASGQIASTSQSLASSASQQASSLEEISSSLEQMSSMTLENASNANQAKTISSSANNLAKDGNSIMKGLLGSMEDIKTASDSTAKIIKSIDEIAFQTNLLALNAAVEAARAGEAGKGFAVVAEEVRNLAMRSADAAKTTSDLIQSLKDSADNGVNISGEAAEKFSQILSETEKVQTIVTEIDVATSEQKNGIEQLNNAVTQINQLTQSNAAVSEEAASSSEELSSQAQMLKELVAKFDLTDDSGIALRKSA